MIVALWIIAVCEVIRAIQNMMQLAMVRKDTGKLSDGLYQIQDGRIHKYKAKGGTVRTYEMGEIVRCEDCKKQSYCHKTVAKTKRHDGFIEYWSEPIEWCSRGERREEGGE